jgi:DNA helicase HerA-like ATPase
MELGIGEALVSTLDDKGQPTIVQKTLVRPPNSRVGPITDAELKAVMQASPVAGVYDKTVDRESASEILQKRSADQASSSASEAEAKQAGRSAGGGSRSDSFWTTLGKTLVKTGVPLATKVLTDALKGRTRR